MLSAVTTFSACLPPLFGSHRQVHQARAHIDNITATYQINSTKHERRPHEDGQKIVTEICRVLIDVFYKHF